MAYGYTKNKSIKKGSVGEMGEGGSDLALSRSSPEDLHLVLEGLQLLWGGLRDLEDLDGHVAVPLAPEHGPEGAGADPLQHGHLPGVHLPVVGGVSVPPAVLGTRYKTLATKLCGTPSSSPTRHRKTFFRLQYSL